MSFVLLSVPAIIFAALANTTATEPVQPTPLILEGKVEPSDGDSLRMGEKRIRLFGIDAVESYQKCDLNGEEWACGRASRMALERLTKGQRVRCEVRDMDRERYVSVCTTEQGVDINDQMVRRGWAVAYRQYSLDYVGAEDEAKAGNLALWRSKFELPHDFRAGLRKAALDKVMQQKPPSTDCLIKGNLSRSGTKIYHMPGQADYKRTSINLADGEHWFCSAEEAESAGWRAAKR